MKYSFLGLTIDAITMGELNSLIKEIIAENRKAIIANHNLHSLYIINKDLKMKMFYSLASYIHIDGMSLVFLGKLLGFPLKREHRITYVDWILPLMRLSADNNWKVFFLGSKPGVAEKAIARLKEYIPNLRIECQHGYFDMSKSSYENTEVLKKINKFQPHILLVGMGMPRQEHWILDNLEEIDANIILTAGACMDYVAGEIPTPPRWMGKIGLEWLFRLLSEPKRLWRRYLVEPWYILKLVFVEFIKNKRLS